METIDINVGKYKFKIIDNTLLSRDQIIYSRNFKIGGNVSDCVNISIRYIQGKPVSAYIPHIIYDPDCSIDIPLENGKGTISMVKTLLDYVHKKLPTITEVSFEDKSNIECATDMEIQKKGSRIRKKETNLCPIPLYYFSIAFNGETWYEKHFNARQKDINKHTKYKEKINKLLYFEEEKSNTTFLQFLEIAQPPKHLYDELEKYYNISKTFGVFFTSIPKIDRCRVVRDWISNFMEYYLKDVFSNADWVIEIPSSSRGGKKNTRKYYCPNGRILNNKTYKDFGITMLDV
jgi:hypothetical protein